jgi:hypothetical protein
MISFLPSHRQRQTSLPRDGMHASHRDHENDVQLRAECDGIFLTRCVR